MNQDLQVVDAGEMVEFAPVNIQVVGKTSTDKKLSVIHAGVSFAAAAYLSNMKGKIGQAVRDTMSNNGEVMIARNVLVGNYKPLAEAIAVVLGQNIQLTSRKDYDALPWSFQHALANLRNEGFGANGKPSAQRTALLRVLSLLKDVQAQADAIKAHQAAERQAKIDEATKAVSEQEIQPADETASAE